MAMQYTQQLEIILSLMDAPLDDRKDILSKGQAAFDAALEVFPDETLPHAHALFAKLCVRIDSFEKSLKLFDEAIRRASIPLEDFKKSTESKEDDDDDDDSKPPPPPEILEAESLVKQLVLERNRAHFSHLQTSLDQWDNANNALHGGGIPPETSPMDPLSIVQHQLNVFPNPHPQSLFDKATFLVLLLDSPSKDEDWNRTAKAWEAYDVYSNAQTWAFGAYTHGKKRNLAGGKPCAGKEKGFGVTVGGLGWSNYALESHPFQSATNNANGDDNNSFMGTVTLQNVIVSGKDAVISGYGDNCQVFVPHRYVNLANNIPLVTSWESSVHELTMGDNSMWMTYIPWNNPKAYGGKIGKDSNGNDVLKIPDPKPRTTSRGLDSAVLLSGYASDNYYHFVAEVLPALVVMGNELNKTLSATNDDGKGSVKDVIMIPSLQHEFVEGFLRLMLPDAFPDNKPSKHLLQWGANIARSNTTASKYLTPHPITYARRLHAAIWDQPKEAPSPVFGASHCLTPSPLLVAMRQAVWDAVDSFKNEHETMPNSNLTVVYCPRSSSATRSLKEEDKLVVQLKRVVSELGGEVIIFEKSSDDQSDQSPLDFVIDSVELFRSANVIVGVHGAYSLKLA